LYLIAKAIWHCHAMCTTIHHPLTWGKLSFAGNLPVIRTDLSSAVIGQLSPHWDRNATLCISDRQFTACHLHDRANIGIALHVYIFFHCERRWRVEICCYDRWKI